MPRKSVAVVGIGVGLEDNIIIHSVNNILILLSMINSVNVKNNNNNKLQIANRKNTYYVSIIFYVNTVIIDSRIRILLTLCIIIFSCNPSPNQTNAGLFRGFFPLIDNAANLQCYVNAMQNQLLPISNAMSMLHMKEPPLHSRFV